MKKIAILFSTCFFLSVAAFADYNNSVTIYTNNCSIVNYYIPNNSILVNSTEAPWTISSQLVNNNTELDITLTTADRVRTEWMGDEYKNGLYNQDWNNSLTYDNCGGSAKVCNDVVLDELYFIIPVGITFQCANQQVYVECLLAMGWDGSRYNWSIGFKNYSIPVFSPASDWDYVGFMVNENYLLGICGYSYNNEFTFCYEPYSS